MYCIIFCRLWIIPLYKNNDRLTLIMEKTENKKPKVSIVVLLAIGYVLIHFRKEISLWFATFI